jgi:GDP-L-fucose synthase
MNKNFQVLITGANGMVGKAMVKKLKLEGFKNILTPTSDELDLRSENKTEIYFKSHNIKYVFHFAAKVGGISANIKYPAEFLYDNLKISCNIINFSKEYNVIKLINLGSSCIYPRECRQPMIEEFLLSGKLEPTNEAYALAKISALKLCEFYNKQYGTNFISLMPPNIYGYNDHFYSENSHVISSLITKFYEAKKNNLEHVSIWGTGKARREFIFVEDVVDGIFHFFLKYDSKDLPNFINIGTNSDISISELALLIKNIINYKGKIIYDKTKPDGMPKKLLNSKISKSFGWHSKVKLSDGIKMTYDWFLNNINN